jgi:hypothetical protein
MADVRVVLSYPVLYERMRERDGMFCYRFCYRTGRYRAERGSTGAASETMFRPKNTN